MHEEDQLHIKTDNEIHATTDKSERQTRRLLSSVRKNVMKQKGGGECGRIFYFLFLVQRYDKSSWKCDH